MLDFTLSARQLELKERAQAFARDEIRPVSRAYDLSGDWAEPVFRKAWEAGFLQGSVPAALGGSGHGPLDEVVVNEELAWGCAGLYTAISANSLASTPILLAGTEAQQQQWLTRLAEAPRFASFALTEPDAGSDAGAIACRAEKRGQAYVLNGTKCFCTGGDHADFLVVFAKTDPARGIRGISALIVPGDIPGLKVGRSLDKMGQRASRQVEIHFRNAEVPCSHLLGGEGAGFLLAMKTLDRTRSVVASGAVGLGRAAYELALDHARTRVQFGKPIFAHQAVGFMLADMATKLEGARLLTWQAAWMAEQGLPCSRQSAMAKTAASDAAMDIATDAVQILGGNGYSRDHLAEKFFRDAKLMQIYEGTNQIQRMIIAKSLQELVP